MLMAVEKALPARLYRNLSLFSGAMGFDLGLVPRHSDFDSLATSG
jgi:site-specific DNA-cytosine methylase